MHNSIILVSHCILNPNSKLKKFSCKKRSMNINSNFISFIFENNIGVIQLPCPEFIIYGPNRWGHTSNQFDNSMYIHQSKKAFNPIKEQLKDYISIGTNILGIIGVKGSPSCGVKSTSVGDWGGSFNSNEKLDLTLSSIKYVNRPGVFIREVQNILVNEDLNLNYFEYDSKNIDKLKKEILCKLK